MKIVNYTFILILSTFNFVLSLSKNEMIFSNTHLSNRNFFYSHLRDYNSLNIFNSKIQETGYSENEFGNQYLNTNYSENIFYSYSWKKTKSLSNLENNSLLENNFNFLLYGNRLNESNLTYFSDSSTGNQKQYIFKYNHLEPIEPIFFKPEKNKIHFGKLALVTSGTAVSIGILHYHQSRAWWQATRTKFHFQNDWEYALWIDKLGHWWGATAIQHIFSSSLSWSNFSDQSSMILGSILAFTYQLYVETYDGYASDWGFSPGDALFDFGGAFYPLLQYYIPPLKNINLKLSYFPSKRLLNKVPSDSLYRNKFVIDDYEGQSFYLSFKINNMLPESLEKFWPDFLCLSFGYQMRNWNGFGSADKNYYIALDYDLEQIPLYGKFWQFLKNTFNLFHLPSPGLRFSNRKITFTIAY